MSQKITVILKIWVNFKVISSKRRSRAKLIIKRTKESNKNKNSKKFKIFSKNLLKSSTVSHRITKIRTILIKP